MTVQTHNQITNFIWSICNLLRGPYKRNEYRKVILPLTVLRRFDCILAPTKEKVLKAHKSLKGKSENIINAKLREVTGVPFYNLSTLTFTKLLDDPNQIALNLDGYIRAFSPNVRRVFERFDFGVQINKMNEKNLLFEVIRKFSSPEIDLSPDKIDNMQMGYIFEELIRIGAEQANEEAGEHFTPREVIKLMVNLLFNPDQDMRELSKSHVVVKIYDPACGTGGMLSVSEKHIRSFNATAQLYLFGQDWNDDAWAVCRSDMLIKDEEANNIKLGCTFEHDGFKGEEFNYMLANPPFGVEWKQQAKKINDEHDKLGYDGRFGAGLPRINDGSLLFLQHMISKMRQPQDGGSRIGIVFNGSPLFTGDAGSGESEIRRWIIEKDMLEAIVALPDQLFYNTGISTYIWILTNKKEPHRKGKIQLIDAREFYEKMRKSLGNKRNFIGSTDEGQFKQVELITSFYGKFRHNEITVLSAIRRLENGETDKDVIVSKIFDNADFGYNKITVERPLRLNFQASDERIARIEEQRTFIALAESNKKDKKVREKEIEEGKKRQEAIKQLLFALKEYTNNKLYKDRQEFAAILKDLAHKKGLSLSSTENKAVHTALSERDETAAICVDKQGKPEADPELRDTENVPLKENIEKYFKREVLPHVPDARIDHSKTKTGYEIPLNRHFYRYEPPRPLEEIEADIRVLETEIVSLWADITGSNGSRKEL